MFRQFDPAPVEPDDLAAALAPFGQSRMLPRGAYIDAAVFAWEQRTIFSGWHCVGHAADMEGVGAQRAVGLGENGLLLVRGDDSRVRAFANVCRHRGHELLAGGASATRRSIVCPYHSWSYRLTGELHHALRFAAAGATFDPSQFGLVELPLVNWHGYLFADPAGVDDDFDGHVAGMEQLIGPYRPEGLVIAGRHSYEVNANWKVIVENYQECYHCAGIHPELSRISPPTSGENLDLPGTWLGGWMSLVDGADTMSLTGRSGGVAIEGLSEQQLRTVLYLVGFPNLLVSLHPDYVMTHLLTPLAADRTLVSCAWAFPTDAVQSPGFDPSYAMDFWDLTNRQDWTACESVQRGLSSPHARPGPLAPDEDGVYQFVTRVARAYAGNR